MITFATMREFKTTIKVRATDEEVYAALTKPFAIELWTGYPATMSTEAGSEFELWEGDICGRNIRFEENQLIEQEWYFEQEEASIVTIKISKISSNKTSIYVRQTNIPDDMFENISEGWKDLYLASLRHFLEDDE